MGYEIEEPLQPFMVSTPPFRAYARSNLRVDLRAYSSSRTGLPSVLFLLVMHEMLLLLLLTVVNIFSLRV